ncbi:MAG: hypothetical protein M9947_15565 [Thermomicrobiales bacterium]|nr:hypothetical protein [Thermomicrobiales bacterium]
MNENEHEHEVEVVLAEGAELEAVRRVVLAAYPDCVPELIQGATVQELLDAIEPARAAYARVAETMAERSEVAMAVNPPVVPAGGTGVAIDPGALPAAEKVRRGLAGQRR